MIVVIHILGKSGVLNNETSFLSSILDNSIYIIVLSCINCYGLISGYVGYREEEINHKFSSFFYLWIQVVFYGITIILILMLTGLAEIGINDFIEVLLPITRNQYWYFTAYFGVFIFSPYINKLVSVLKKEDALKCIILFGIVFSIYATFANNIGGDPFLLNEGYSSLWLIILYFVGALIKKNDWDKIFKSTKILMIVLSGCFLFSLVWRFCFGFISKIIIGSIWGEKMFMSYMSPTTVLISICLFIFFARLKLSSIIVKKLIKIFSSATFGVYLIHMQPLLVEVYLKDKFLWIANFKNIVPPLLVLTISIIILFLCLFIDICRGKIFTLLRIQNRLKKIESNIRKYFASNYIR